VPSYGSKALAMLALPTFAPVAFGSVAGLWPTTEPLAAYCQPVLFASEGGG
jgi:hypothetical protein